MDFHGKNPAGFTQLGTELSKANLLSDYTAHLFDRDSKAVPDDILEIIGEGLPIKNGGTGATTASGAIANLFSGLPIVSTADSNYYVPLLLYSAAKRIPFTSLVSSVISSIAPEAIGAAQIETGTYTGTGTWGSSDPNTLSFSFAPALVYVGYYGEIITVGGSSSSGGTSTDYDIHVSMLNKWTTSYTESIGFGTQRLSKSGYTGENYPLYGKKSSDGKTLYWYSSLQSGGSVNIWGPAHQMNTSGTEYTYFAIG